MPESNHSSPLIPAKRFAPARIQFAELSFGPAAFAVVVTNPRGMETRSLPLWPLKKKKSIKRKTCQARRMRRMVGSVSTAKLFEAIHYVPPLFYWSFVCLRFTLKKTAFLSLGLSPMSVSLLCFFWHKDSSLAGVIVLSALLRVFAFYCVTYLWTKRTSTSALELQLNHTPENNCYFISFAWDGDAEVADCRYLQGTE